MNESAYVLTVEALVFGVLCTVLLAQRLNVFAWPPDRSWPVFASCLQLVLFSATALQCLCCFLGAGRMAPDIRDACSRSAGRLGTVVLLSGIYVGTIAMLYNTEERACVLCQLCGLTCTPPGTTLSYGLYLAVLLPASVIQAGIIITAAGMCKEQHCSPRRLATANCAWLLTLHVSYSLHESVNLSTCSAADAGHIVVSTRVLGLTVVLCSLDILAEILATVRHTQVIRFAFIRVLQLVSVVCFNVLFDEEKIPWPLLIAHASLSSLLALLDVFELHSCAEFATTIKAESEQLVAPIVPSVDAVLDITEQTLRQGTSNSFQQAPLLGVRAPFEVTPARRRTFMLAFNDKARWPRALATTPKKIL